MDDIMGFDCFTESYKCVHWLIHFEELGPTLVSFKNHIDGIRDLLTSKGETLEASS